MKLFPKSLFSALIIGAVCCASLSMAMQGPSDTQQGANILIAQKIAKASPAKATQKYLQTTSVELLKNPAQYLNKSVQFEGTFNSFSGLGLDYKKAFRDSKEFISILILRSDVEHHKIPLAELKLFYPRNKSEAVLKLESGDVISIKGKVFSTALNDPWIEIDEVEVIQKIHPKPEEKVEQECC